MRDLSGRCALDYALYNRNEKSLRVLLRASMKVPPRAREHLFVHPNKHGVPLFIDELARTFPHVLLDFLNELGLDEYESYDGRPQLERAADSFFVAEDETSMVLKGWPTCSPPQGTVDVDELGAVEIRSQGIWSEVLVELEDPHTTSHTVDCRIVGIPRLLAKPSPSSLAPSFCQMMKKTGAKASCPSTADKTVRVLYAPATSRLSDHLTQSCAVRVLADFCKARRPLRDVREGVDTLGGSQQHHLD
jgi:hypothetical protein